MKLPLLVLATAALVTAQTPPKSAPTGNAPVPAAASATGHATLADLTRDFQEKKLAALELYVKTHGTATDAADALLEAIDLTKELGRPGDTLRFADLYLKQFPQGSAGNAVQLSRAGALRDNGDVAGAQQAYESLIDKAGDDLDLLVQATTEFGTMLAESGKRAEAVELANVVGASRPARGFKEYLGNIGATFELIGAEPKPIAASDTAGKPIDVAADYRGKVLLIDFWATWCGPCMQELPNVLAAYEKYHGKGFEILGISLDNDRAAFDKVVADRKMTWRHCIEGAQTVAEQWGVRSIPATYLVGADGKIVATGLRGQQLERRLAKLFGASAGATPAAPAAPKK